MTSPPNLGKFLFALILIIVPALCWTNPINAEERSDTQLSPEQRLARGKLYYGMLCAGCHGDDGESTARSENTKTLPGISIRRTEEEIGHRLRGFIATLFTDEERADLVAYVKSLKGTRGYARPELLIDATALTPFITDPDVRIVDLRPIEAYDRSHLPNAVHLDADTLRMLPDAERFTALMEEIGVGDDTYVVAYDDNAGQGAARLWSALTCSGHQKVSLFDGGWRKWVSDGRETTVWRPSRRTVTFIPRPQPDVFVTTAELRARLKARDTRLLDVGSVEASRGKRSSKGAGSPSGAVHVEWTSNLRPDGTFRPAAELRSLYAAAGVTPDRRIITVSADAAQAAMTMFTLRLIGYLDVRVYDGGWQDRSARAGRSAEPTQTAQRE